MGYRFRRKDRSVERALRRIARWQIDGLVSAIDDGGDPAVHEVRKGCKKLRGLLRLVRSSFESYADENADFRDTARLLGAFREAVVLEETFERLAAERSGTPTNAHPMAPATPRVDAAARKDGLSAARDRLVLARQRVRGWTLAADGWTAIGPGLMHTYLHARTALEQIGPSHAAARYHELRKQVKYHWHHVLLLHPIAAKELRGRARLADELGNRLGEHHDLAQLESALRDDPLLFGSGDCAKILQTRSRERRLELETEAGRLARQLLAESAESLTVRLEANWEHWREGEHAAGKVSLVRRKSG